MTFNIFYVTFGNWLKKKRRSNLKVWIHSFIQQISLESLLCATSCSRYWGKKKITLCHAHYLIMKILPCLVGSFLLLLSGDPLATSPERIVWQEEGHICKSPPLFSRLHQIRSFSVDQVPSQTGSRNLICKDLVTLKLLKMPLLRIKSGEVNLWDFCRLHKI